MTPNGENKARVAIYIRVSTHHQIDKDSLPMQRKDLIAYTKLILNTDKYEIFEDAGYSGKDTLRPSLQNMMSKVRSGEFTHVLVWKIDRISRNLLDFANMYKELKDYGVTFVSKNEQFDTSTAIGEAMLKIILVFAELERNMTAERVTATMISRAANGLWNGGKIPYGYNYDPETKKFSINSDEASFIHLIHDTYEKNGSLVRIARYFNDNGYRTRSGSEWTPSTLSIILKSIFYCGDYLYNKRKDGSRQKNKNPADWITVENHHMAIISREQKERVLAMLNQNIRMSKNVLYTSKNVHIFKGIIKCGMCGFTFTSTSFFSKKDNFSCSRYQCPSKRKSNSKCRNKSVSDPLIGDFVLNYICNILTAKTELKNIYQENELQKILLSGNIFSYIDKIHDDDLAEIYAILTKTSKNKIFSANPRFATSTISLRKKINNLKRKRSKAARALDRLTALYLYSDTSISEIDFIRQKEQLVELIESIDAELDSGIINNSISDSDFINQASQFILTKNLEGKKYISYVRLAKTINETILKNFVSSIIEQITIVDGKVQSIIFKNGLAQTFIFKQ